jgi:4a-hydroxytetrahydrobiopterin dehydratase
MRNLASKVCEPCRTTTVQLSSKRITDFRSQLDPHWDLAGGKRLERVFSFPDFKSALAFANRIGDLAEEQGHHPDLELSWGRLKVVLWTHKTGGLSESDFVLAAKIDRLPAV